jgi:hypothetical protein
MFHLILRFIYEYGELEFEVACLSFIDTCQRRANSIRESALRCVLGGKLNYVPPTMIDADTFELGMGQAHPALVRENCFSKQGKSDAAKPPIDLDAANWDRLVLRCLSGLRPTVCEHAISRSDSPSRSRAMICRISYISNLLLAIALPPRKIPKGTG